MTDPNDKLWLIIPLIVAIGLPLLIMFFNRFNEERLKRGLQTGQFTSIIRWSYGYIEWNRFVNDWLSRRATTFDLNDPDEVWKHRHNYGDDNQVKPPEIIISAEDIVFNNIMFELQSENQPKASYRAGNPAVLLIDYLERGRHKTYQRRMTIPIPQSQESSIAEVIDKFNSCYANCWWNK